MISPLKPVPCYIFILYFNIIYIIFRLLYVYIDCEIRNAVRKAVCKKEFVLPYSEVNLAVYNRKIRLFVFSQKDENKGGRSSSSF